MNACLAAPYNGRITQVAIPSLWSLLQKVEPNNAVSLDPTISSAGGVSTSSLSEANWDGCIYPTSSLHIQLISMCS